MQAEDKDKWLQKKSQGVSETESVKAVVERWPGARVQGVKEGENNARLREQWGQM